MNDGATAVQAAASGSVRRGPDGLPDAGDGRLRGHARHPRHGETAGPGAAPPADHRADRARHEGRPGDAASPRAWTTT